MRRSCGARAGLLGLLFSGLGCSAVQGAAVGLEDAAQRAALPEFMHIPAATPGELTPAAQVDAASFKNWTRSHGDNGSRRYSALDQITRENVGNLEIAWIYRSQDGAANVQCIPVVAGGMMYMPTPGRAIVAVDARTGIERWRVQMDQPERLRPEDTPARRGLVYWPGDANNAPRLLFGCGDWIYAVNPQTGAAVPGFGEAGRTPIPTGACAGGVVFRHTFVTAGQNGDVYGYDVRTGKALWRFHSVARGDEFGADTWDGPQRGANSWTGLSVDDQRGIVYAAFGAPHPDMVGVARLGDNLFSNCLVALDALTGERRWHFQDIRHDIWDLDLCGPPNLVTITRDGKRVDAVTAFSKGGNLLLLDRLTGKPIFPYRLRRASVSKLPGERTAAYQPDPELPEPISRMAFNPADITTRTPEATAFVRKAVERSNYSFFQPFEEGKPTLYTGSRGGAEWSGAAVDVPTGRLYITSNRWVSRITVIKNDERDRDPQYPPSAGEKVYAQFCAACHGPSREGLGVAPSLLSLKSRMTDVEALALLKTGRGIMPSMDFIAPQDKRDLVDFLLRRNQPPSKGINRDGRNGESPPQYVFDGFKFLTDHEGYPGVNPPWGLLNCYDLNTGKILWRVPLGELEALTKQGVPLTGSQNLGGATVTAGGLVFVAGTEDEKLRAFDVDTGRELWSAKLPFAGTAAPAVYEIDGIEHVVITATGGGRVGGASGPGDAYVAFRLKK